MHAYERKPARGLRPYAAGELSTTSSTPSARRASPTSSDSCCCTSCRASCAGRWVARCARTKRAAARMCGGRSFASSVLKRSDGFGAKGPLLSAGGLLAAPHRPPRPPRALIDCAWRCRCSRRAAMQCSDTCRSCGRTVQLDMHTKSGRCSLMCCRCTAAALPLMYRCAARI